MSVIVGHSAEIRDESLWGLGRRRNPFKWKIFVEGKGEDDISSYVKEIVFHLHETFTPPIRSKYALNQYDRLIIILDLYKGPID